MVPGLYKAVTECLKISELAKEDLVGAQLVRLLSIIFESFLRSVFKQRKMVKLSLISALIDNQGTPEIMLT